MHRSPCSAAALALLMLACGGADSGLPSGQPAGSAPSTGLDPSLPAPPGTSRAGIVRDGPDGEAALFGGINAEGAAGDIKLHNAQVQFIIQRATRSHGIVDVGGHVIDADLVRAPGQLGRDTLEDQFLAFGMSRVVHHDALEIVADGSAGGPAIVRATGRDVPWPFMLGLTERTESLVPDLTLEVESVYTLEPDAWTLRIDTTFTNAGEDASTFTLQDGLLASGEDLTPWAPGVGLEGPQSGDLPAVVLAGLQGEATLSMWPTEGAYRSSPITTLAAEMGLALAERTPTTLAPGDALVVSRSLTLAPDTLTAEAERRAAQGGALVAVSGTVIDPDGAGVAGARVHLVQEGEARGYAITDAAGAFSGALPAGPTDAWVLARALDEQVPLPEGAGRFGGFAAPLSNAGVLGALDGTAPATDLPWAGGRATVAATSFAAGGDGPLTIEVPDQSALRVRLVDGEGAPLPGVLDLRHAEGAADSLVPEALREALGEPTGSRAAWAWSRDGDTRVLAPPGDYLLSAGHSWRHGRVEDTPVTLVEGEDTELVIILPEIVPRDGWLSVDTHLHGAPSFDGALPMEDRLITCAATGVDLPVTTDHDRQADYRELSAALGLDARMQVVPGVEVTTILRGHFNLFPIEPRPRNRVNGGALSWWAETDTTEGLFSRMRAAAGPDALLQVNHPRTPGMFDFAAYDPETGTPGRETHFSWDFELFELWNGGVDDREELRADWFSMLDRGMHAVPTGVSDSHYRFIPCGMGRTDVWLDEVDPAAADIGAVVAALEAGEVVVAAGVTLRATVEAGGEVGRPGASLTGTEATVRAEVRAPAWVVPDTLRVWQNGVVVVEEDLPDAPTSGLWAERRWTLDVPEDAWIVVEVEGATPMGSTWRNTTPYAITGAVRIDAEGDGWVAPRAGE